MGYFCSGQFVDGKDMEIHILPKEDELLTRFRVASNIDFCVEFVVKDIFSVVISVPNMKVVCAIPAENSDRYALTDEEYKYLVKLIKKYAGIMYEMEYKAVPSNVRRSGVLLYKVSFGTQHNDIAIYLPDDTVINECHVYIVNGMTNDVYVAYLTSDKGVFIGNNFSYSDVVMFLTAHWDEIIKKWNERFMSDNQFYI